MIDLNDIEDVVERKLFGARFHWCRRCERWVARATVTAVRSGWRVDVICHNTAGSRTVRRSEVEDSRRLDHYEARVPVEQVRLTASALAVFDVVAGVAELVEHGLVVVKPGALLPTLTARGVAFAKRPTS